MIFLKTEDEIELLRQSNLLVGRTLAEVAKVVKPGVTTRELDKVAITSRHPQTGEVYLALFNTSDEKEISVGVELKELGIEGTAEITDLWTGQSLGKVSAKVEQKLSPHASVLYKITQ